MVDEVIKFGHVLWVEVQLIHVVQVHELHWHHGHRDIESEAASLSLGVGLEVDITVSDVAILVDDTTSQNDWSEVDLSLRDLVTVGGAAKEEGLHL